MEDNTLYVEEMGSSNGSWLNSHKLIVGKKTAYKNGDVIYLGKASAAISLMIENLCMQKASANSDDEKTLIFKVGVPAEQKIEAASARLVANGSPVVSPAQSSHMTKPSMKIVENITEHKHGLEDKVKNLINQEADKLREMALKDSTEILKGAHAKEKDILEQAHHDAKAIVEEAKASVLLLKKEAEQEIHALEEKGRAIKTETEDLLKNYKSTAARIDNTIKNLKNDESQVQQKIKSLEDNVSSIQDKIRSETILLEDVKAQALTLKKSADIKFEETVMEERRARARIETEMIEAKTQTAKIFAEAEKVQSQKSMMEADISELRSTKGQIERDVNEMQINFKRQEYELEKLNREYNTLLDNKIAAEVHYENLLAEGKGLADKFIDRENALIEEQKDLQEKVDGLRVMADQMIEQAEANALQITHTAHARALELAEELKAQQRELAQKKSDFYAEFEIEKKNKFQELAHEMDKQKALYNAELKKIEQKKENVFTETKWLEESAQKKCEKIVSQGLAEVESLKSVLQKENERYKATLDLEYQSLKALHLKENEAAKTKAQSEVQALKDQAHKDIFQLRNQAAAEITAKNEEIEKHSQQMKLKADQVIHEEKLKWDGIHQKLQAEIKAAEEVTKQHAAALAKTEALQDESFLEARQKIEQMMTEARAEVKAVEYEAEQLREKEAADLLEMKKEEMERIEALKDKYEQSRIENRQEMAHAASLAVHEFLTNDMIKQRNLILNESLIKKIAERARKLVVEANLGRIHASENGLKAFPTKDYRKIFRWFYRLCGVTAFFYMVFYVWTNYPNEVQMVQTQAEKYIKDNKLTVDDIPSKDQIIEMLR